MKPIHKECGGGVKEWQRGAGGQPNIPCAINNGAEISEKKTAVTTGSSHTLVDLQDSRTAWPTM